MAAGSGVKLVRVRRAARGITSGKFGVASWGRVSCMGAIPGRGGFRSSDVCLK